jgi:hypothetical protein
MLFQYLKHTSCVNISRTADVADEGEFSDTDDSSYTHFGGQQDDALLRDSGDNSGVGDTVYMSDNNSLW